MKNGVPEHKVLEIHVHRTGNGAGHKKGTFTGPPPKLRLDVNDYMQWTLKVDPPDDTATFEIRFPGFSWPFAGNPALIGGTSATPSADLQAINGNLYHYAVKVTTVEGDFTIKDCPEGDVG
jgi:hypothetical protein